jgi:uncharacterized protein (TIGR03790 family)
VPNATGHLTARDIGLVINTADPYSVEVGEYYARARGLASWQVLRVELPVDNGMSVVDFRKLESRINEHFDGRTQALALAWKGPYMVGSCNSITGALALGYDEALCANSCMPSRLSPYFNTATSKPFADLRMRPVMLLAARDVAGAKALIDRGVKADHSLAFRGGAPVNAYFVRTSDSARSVRASLFPPAGLVRQVGLDVHVESTEALDNPKRVLVYETGRLAVERLNEVDWVPGALADHLTSFGGALQGVGDQMSILEWIASGATASYGTVSEPCAHPQKFPHPQVLLLHYVQGETAIEAYWKSVAWPQQGVFVGEPLAAPYSR